MANPAIFLFLSRDYPHYSQILALITFIIAALTDGLDGYLARKRDIITKFGKIVDPLADKLTIVSILLVLIYLHFLHYQ